MVSRGEDKYIVYPIYFNKLISRCAGRKIPLEDSVENPTLENIAKAA